jgi:hypothetical protein
MLLLFVTLMTGKWMECSRFLIFSILIFLQGYVRMYCCGDLRVLAYLIFGPSIRPFGVLQGYFSLGEASGVAKDPRVCASLYG